MKNIVAKIFGKETAEDTEIVAFYEYVHKIAMDEYAIEYHQNQVKELSLVLNENTEGNERVSELIDWCRKEYQKRPEMYIGDDTVVKTIKNQALKGYTLNFSLMEAYRVLKNNLVFADNRRANG